MCSSPLCPVFACISVLGLFDASELPFGFGPLSRPSGAGYRCLADQHLPGPGCERLVHLLDATPLSRQQEQGLLVRSAEHGGEEGTVVLDPFQHLAALAYSQECTRCGADTSVVGQGVGGLYRVVAFVVHAE